MTRRAIKLQFFEGKILPGSVPLDTGKALWTNLPKNFAGSHKIFRQKLKSDKNAFSRSSSVHVECGLDNPAKKIRKRKEFFAPSPENF